MNRRWKEIIIREFKTLLKALFIMGLIALAGAYWSKNYFFGWRESMDASDCEELVTSMPNVAKRIASYGGEKKYLFYYNRSWLDANCVIAVTIKGLVKLSDEEKFGAILLTRENLKTIDDMDVFFCHSSNERQCQMLSNYLGFLEIKSYFQSIWSFGDLADLMSIPEGGSVAVDIDVVSGVRILRVFEPLVLLP